MSDVDNAVSVTELLLLLLLAVQVDIDHRHSLDGDTHWRPRPLTSIHAADLRH